MYRWMFTLVALTAANLSCDSRQPKAIEVEKKDNASSEDAPSTTKPKRSSANRGARFGQDNDASLGGQFDNNGGSGSGFSDPSASSDPSTSGDPLRDSSGGSNGFSGAAPAGGIADPASAPTSLSDEEIATQTGLTVNAVAAGREYLRGQNAEPWNGEQDEPAINGHWRLQQPSFASAPAGSVLPSSSPSSNALPGLNNPSGLPGLNNPNGLAGAGSQTPNSGAGVTANGPVVFRIPAGTASRPWNTSANPIVVKLNSSFTIVNGDNTVHQLHSDGLSFPHGAPIPPGGSESFTARSLQVGPTYDHIVGPSAQVFIQVVN